MHLYVFLYFFVYNFRKHSEVAFQISPAPPFSRGTGVSKVIRALEYCGRQWIALRRNRDGGFLFKHDHEDQN